MQREIHPAWPTQAVESRFPFWPSLFARYGLAHPLSFGINLHTRRRGLMKLPTPCLYCHRYIGTLTTEMEEQSIDIYEYIAHFLLRHIDYWLSTLTLAHSQTHGNNTAITQATPNTTRGWIGSDGNSLLVIITMFQCKCVTRKWWEQRNFLGELTERFHICCKAEHLNNTYAT